MTVPHPSSDVPSPSGRRGNEDTSGGFVDDEDLVGHEEGDRGSVVGGLPGTQAPPDKSAVVPPTPSGPDAVPARAHGGGNWRSLVISMLVLLGFVLVWVALTPRIERVDQPAVDVGASARAMYEQRGWNVLVPSLGSDWKPTSVSYDAAADGMQIWHAGYHQGPEAQAYVSVDEGRTSAGDAVRDAWVSKVVSYGKQSGTAQLGGRTWERFTAEGNVTRYALVHRGAQGESTVVVSGIASTTQVDAVAASLAPHRAG